MVSFAGLFVWKIVACQRNVFCYYSGSQKCWSRMFSYWVYYLLISAKYSGFLPRSLLNVNIYQVCDCYSVFQLIIACAKGGTSIEDLAEKFPDMIVKVVNLSSFKQIHDHLATASTIHIL